jgi:SAM-dependent methyltransferase
MRLPKILHKTKLKLLSTSALRMGYVLQPKGLGYFKPEELVRKAQNAHLTLCEFIEQNNIGGIGKRRDKIIQTIVDLNILKQHSSFLEIGAGTGMFLEKCIDIYNPIKYEVYETSKEWSNYLLETYKIKSHDLICHTANGHDLHNTKNESVDTIMIHAVFVYLPILKTLKYLDECVRVCKSDGFIIFDCFTNKVFNLHTIQKWRNDDSGYSFPVIIDIDLLTSYFIKNNLDLVHAFNINYHAAETTYFILKKK